MKSTEPGSTTDNESIFLDETGLAAQEVLDMHSIARKAASAEKSILSRRILEQASPETSARIAQAFFSVWLHGFSKIGQYGIFQSARDQLNDIRSLDWLLTNFLVDPVNYRNVAAWCFHFALQESSADFQLDCCPSPTSEERLSGMLLGKISTHCDAWTRVASEPLKRAEAKIALSTIDLSVLGGEQATGGDFGLVLDFDEKRTQQAVRPDGSSIRIIPLIFQAKRYVRPRADVSRRHRIRGYQRDLLTKNKCASAYIFYENDTTEIDLPIPPLVKSVDRVAAPGRTVVFEDSLDLPSYLFKAMYDASFGPTASSPEDALRMIFSKAEVGQLSTLAVISDSSTANLRYKRALRDLSPEIRRQWGRRTIGDREL